MVLSESAKWADLMYHPTGNLFGFGTQGVDLRCVSQLNVSVANSWMGKWEDHDP